MSKSKFKTPFFSRAKNVFGADFWKSSAKSGGVPPLKKKTEVLYIAEGNLFSVRGGGGVF